MTTNKDTEDVLEAPNLYTRWKHHSGRVYTVLLITNTANTNPEYPVTVCYAGENGNTWSKTLKRFYETMTPLTNKIPKTEVSNEKILKCLHKVPNLPLKKLSEIVGLSKSGLVHRLKKLEEKGLVTNDYGRWIISELGREKLRNDSVKKHPPYEK